MTRGCTCTKVLNRPPAKPEVKLLWNPDCEEHGVDTEIHRRMLANAERIYRKQAELRAREPKRIIQRRWPSAT